MTATAPDIALRVEDLHKAFGSKKILRGLSFEVVRGQTFVILGPSGTGKSVTIKHIVGLVKPDQGRVWVDRTEVTSADTATLNEVRTKIGYLFQSGALINWLSVYDNVALPLTEFTRLRDFEIDRRVDEYLDMVQMAPAKHQMPAELSGGQKRRVALARVLAGTPSIILYDEPTAGLDPITAVRITRLIRSVQQELGVTSILVTHDLPCAFSAGDEIAMFEKGRVVHRASAEEFPKSDNPTVQDFLNAGQSIRQGKATSADPTGDHR